MSAASCLLTEDQFLCSICLDVFTDPVTTPCGHNFCKTCITTYWDGNDFCQCPNCKAVFNRRPELRVNTFISEMAAQYKQSAQQEARSSSSEQHVSKPGEVPCDVCTGTKLKAQKSCLVCLVSYCETHLEPHLTSSGLKRHQLIDPVENLEGRMCKKHDKLLEVFCKNDQMCVCMLCTVADHKKHDVVPLKEEYERKKTELGKTEAEIQQIIQIRRVKIQDIHHSVDISNRNADREITEGVKVFNTLMETAERKLNMLIDTIKEKQRKTEKQAEDFIKELEQEISELEKSRAEVQELSRSEDPLQLLNNVQLLKACTPTKDWTEVRVHSPSYEGTVVRAVSQLEETISEQMKKLFVAELRRVQQYSVNVRVDPDVVHPKPPGRHRGNDCRCVLSMRGFISGRFYFEVFVKKSSSWTLGVVRKLSNLKETITLSPTNGHWTMCLSSQGEYLAAAGPSVRLSLKSQPEKVGVFVNYEEGLVSFYDVDAAALIYSFTGCSFFEDLYPFFSPCQNNGVTIHSSDWGCVLQ
ncbi:nuclear factor 7, ovary-like [Labrus bergylta]|uniref:nuclear factor 7, ovary-like n=1 Tax=Labrus bergylta TaxID=56723 RepID=UPI0033144434